MRTSHGEHGVVVRGAFGLNWDGNMFKSLSTHHCWALSKSSIPSCGMVSDKNNAFGGENRETSDLCEHEQVTLKPQFQIDDSLTTWLQIWYNSLLWGDSIQKGADLERQNCSFGVLLNWGNERSSSSS